MEIGVYTFAELRGDVDPERRTQQLMEEAELADEVGLDVFGVGEHHRPDFAVSAPAVVLGAAAARTRRIRLTSAVTVLTSDDPVRVFQDFATVDLLSGGRAEIMVGRGSFIESFPLFGYDLRDYDELFAEHLDLLLELRASVYVTWSGEHRAAIEGLGVFPRPVQDPLPIWVAVGGNPESAVRAGALGLPMALAIIGGQPQRFVPFAEAGRPRPAPAAQHQLACIRGRLGRAGRRGVLPRLRRDDERDRPGARLDRDPAPGLRLPADAARRARRRQPRAGRREDPLPARAVRTPAVPRADQRRRPRARARAAGDRAPGNRGRARSSRRGRAASRDALGRRLGRQALLLALRLAPLEREPGEVSAPERVAGQHRDPASASCA